MLSWRP